MAGNPWSDEENDRIVADYFAMLAKDAADAPYNKAEHRRRLMSRLERRKESSIERKHQNISAVLMGLGEEWIPGYKPACNFQMALVDAVLRWLARNRDWVERLPRPQATGLREDATLWIGPAANAKERATARRTEADAGHCPPF